MTSLYWQHNHLDTLYVYATPNFSEIPEDDRPDTENYISFGLYLKDSVVYQSVEPVEGKLTVEAYLEKVRNYIEDNLVFAYDEDGELVRHR